MPDNQQHASPQQAWAARGPMHASSGTAAHARPANAFEARQAASTTARCAAWPGERQCPRRAEEGSTRCALHPAAYVGPTT